MKNEFVSREQLEFLPKRLILARETDASKKFEQLVKSLKIRRIFSPYFRGLIIGAGGSYPAAVFAKYVISEKYGMPYVEAATPQTAKRIITQFDASDNFTKSYNPSFDLVIGISYSGKTHDIVALAKLCVERNYPFVLITGAKENSLKGIYPDNVKIISYFNPSDDTGKEKGMISMFSTLAPCVIMDNWNEPLDKEYLYSLCKSRPFIVCNLNIKRIVSLLRLNPIIHVFYEWDTYAAAADIESKFTESGLATVVLHEKKNFTHGRYTLLYKYNFGLAIDLVRYPLTSIGFIRSDTTNYSLFLSDFLMSLCKERGAYYLEISSDLSYSTSWNMEVLALLPYLITEIGEELGIDISKPFKSGTFPEEAKDLYNYEGDF